MSVLTFDLLRTANAVRERVGAQVFINRAEQILNTFAGALK